MSARPLMDCTRVEQDEMIERYVAADTCRFPLSKTETAEFEEHYFACAQCFERLQAARAAHAALMRPKRVLHTFRGWGMAAAAAAAVTIFSYFSYGHLRGPAPLPVPSATAPAPVVLPSNPLAELARLDPPKYEDAAFRGSNSAAEQAFQSAMQRYVLKDYVGAENALGKVTERFPEYVPARFFLGASHLLLNNPDAAIAEMSRVLQQESPFSEETKWVLAKAWLAKNDTAQAGRLLDKLAAGGGDFASAARQLRSRYNLPK